MSGQIFISYRREDSAGWAGRLYDRLSSRFAADKIFMDVVDLAPGVDFVEALEESVGACDVLIAVIGQRWLSGSDEAGNRRLDKPEDFVRIEVATALKRGIRVIPVLVDGAGMPPSGELPEDLKALARRHALEASHTRFSADAERLIGAVEQVLERVRVELQRKREEQERAEAEQRERQEKERLEAERRQEEEAKLRAEQQLRAEQERLEAERQEKERQQAEAEQREVERRQPEEQERLGAQQRLRAAQEPPLQAEQHESERLEVQRGDRQENVGGAAAPLRRVDEAARDGARGVHRARRLDDRADAPRSAPRIHCHPRHRGWSRGRRRAQHVVRGRYRRGNDPHGRATESPRGGVAHRIAGLRAHPRRRRRRGYGPCN
jgi:hypothetical protein